MAKAEPSITGAQVRMGRAFLRWSLAEMAKIAGVGVSTVQAIEVADGEPEISEGLEATRDYRAGAREESLAKIAKALTKAGVTFLPDDGKGPGVRGKP